MHLKWMDNENVIHQKHVDDERQSVTSHHQKGQSKRS